MARAAFFMHARSLLRCGLILSLAAFLALPLPAQVDDAPPIVVQSPDTGTTYVYGSIKNHSLTWDKKEKMLIAHVSFVDLQDSGGTGNEDSHDFRLPGVKLDEAKGIFYACTSKGEAIPVAHFKKTLLFIQGIEVLPNARVRIQRDGGNVSVVLEALRPDDPALKAPPGDTHQINFQDLLN